MNIWEQFVTNEDTSEPRLFVFAAGGSGMRVIKALTILTAAGYYDDYNYTIIPILFDFDLANSSLCQAEECLSLYKQLHQDGGGESFFSHKLRPLYPGDDSFIFDMERQEGSLFEKYRLQALFKECDVIRKLSESLMGDFSTPDSFLRKPLENIPTFVSTGQCNYARLMMGDLSHRDDFCKLFRMVNKEDAFVIVGSTYGNTGSASIFELANTLSTHFNSMHKAVVMLLPYNNLMEERAKNTMKFFSDCHLNDKFDNTYYITTPLSSTLSSEMMGQSQSDHHTIFDMIAATAIADFLMDKNENNRHSYYFFTLPKHRSEGFDIDDLFRTPIGRRLVYYLTPFSLAMKYVYEELTADNNDPVRQKLRKFAEIYYKWIESMEEAGEGIGLSLFHLKDSQFNMLLKDRELIKKNFLFSTPLFNKANFSQAMRSNKFPLIEQLTKASNYIFNHYISENI